ncbi:MAG: hypothetical protein F4Y49_11200 [Dehalococcoidia bacterium]|nr:hypothetical protein [Dehalococcoidia bacterium]
MFSQRESRDELGLGRIRDALSDTLFPGTSVLLTRARYFLFIPWLFREGERRGFRGQRLSSWVERQERQLIGTLRASGDLEGLIGRYVGYAVQNLPSSIYWNSLRRFEILRHEGTATQVVGFRQISQQMDDATEFVERPTAVWDPSIPPAPKDFLSVCDFTLTYDEATWLAERIVEAVPETLLQVLISGGQRLSTSARYAWDDPEASAAVGRVRRALDEARRFAVATHGAALLYNVLLAERAEKLGLSQYEGLRDDFAAKLEDWHREVEASDLGGWDLNNLWDLLAKQGRTIAPLTRSFVSDWVDMSRSRIGFGLVDDRDARELIKNRELHQKRSQARLRNDRLMMQWGGASGSGRLAFRWPVVRDLLNDIADGREQGHARP